MSTEKPSLYLPKTTLLEARTFPTPAPQREKAVSSYTQKGGVGWVLSIDSEEKAIVGQKRRRTTK